MKPTNPITYQQMVEYEASHIKWFKLYGHTTHVKELADIFKIKHSTLINRLKSGWPIEKALMADTKTQWTCNNIQYMTVNIPDVVTILDNFFYVEAPKKRGKK